MHDIADPEIQIDLHLCLEVVKIQNYTIDA